MIKFVPDPRVLIYKNAVERWFMYWHQSFTTPCWCRLLWRIHVHKLFWLHVQVCYCLCFFLVLYILFHFFDWVKNSERSIFFMLHANYPGRFYTCTCVCACCRKTWICKASYFIEIKVELLSWIYMQNALTWTKQQTKLSLLISPYINIFIYF